MRRRLVLYGAAMTTVVLAAFLVPLAVLARGLAEDRAMGTASQEAQGIAVVAAVAADDRLAAAVEGVNARGAQSATVFLPGGRTVGAPATLDDAVSLARAGQAFTVAAPDGGRAVLLPVEGPAGRAVVRVAVPASTLHQGVGRALGVLGGLGAALLLAAVLAAVLLARSVSRPVVRTAAVAHRLASGDLEARVVPAGPSEVVEVGMALNRLAERIGRLLQTERELVADLSHRLRTPVTALRLDAEGLRDPEEAARVSAHVDELQRSIDAVIAAARRPVRSALPQADVVAVAAERGAFWSALAEDQGRVFDVVLPDAPVPVAVDAEELAAALDAVLENAFSHTPEGAPLEVAVERAPDAVLLAVRDGGPGFAPEDLARGVLERGVSGGGSSGLGLDIARRAAEAAGGRLQVGGSRLGGAEVALVLPVRGS
jgi:signal transduction histidine kinase